MTCWEQSTKSHGDPAWQWSACLCIIPIVPTFTTCTRYLTLGYRKEDNQSTIDQAPLDIEPNIGLSTILYTITVPSHRLLIGAMHRMLFLAKCFVSCTLISTCAFDRDPRSRMQRSSQKQRGDLEREEHTFLSTLNVSMPSPLTTGKE